MAGLCRSQKCKGVSVYLDLQILPQVFSIRREFPGRSGGLPKRKYTKNSLLSSEFFEIIFRFALLLILFFEQNPLQKLSLVLHLFWVRERLLRSLQYFVIQTTNSNLFQTLFLFFRSL